MYLIHWFFCIRMSQPPVHHSTPGHVHGHSRSNLPMSTPPGARLMGSGHHAAARNDSVRKRLAEAVKAKNTQHGGKM